MINKAMLDSMLALALDDDKLVLLLKTLLSGAGVDISSKPIDKKTVRKVRALLSKVTDGDIARVTYLYDIFRNGG